MAKTGQSLIPKQWADSDQLDGYDFVDKATLIGTAFRINAVEFYHNANGVLFANVQAEHANGIPFAFNDSSTGVREQLSIYITNRFGEWVDGTVYEIALVAPRGLRLSEYALADDPSRKGKTYYLTTSGTPKKAPHSGVSASTEPPGTTTPADAVVAPARGTRKAK